MNDVPLPSPTAGQPWLAASIVAGLFLLAAMPLVLTNYNSGQVYYDNQNLFHLKAVKTFSEQLPHPDLTDYASATTPLYHLILASIDRWVSDDMRVSRTVNALFAVGFLATLAAAIARENSVRTTVALCLPLVGSWYIFGPALWLEPGNAGWWGVTVVLIIAMRPAAGFASNLIGVVVLLLLALTRQNHLWAASLLWLAAWLDSSGDAVSMRIRRTAAMVLATLPSFMAVAWFVMVWHGTVPPTFQKAHTGGNAAIPATILSIFGIMGMFFLPLILPTLRQKWKGSTGLFLIGGGIGLIVGILPHTSFSREHGRLSGLWNIVARLPTFADRSPLIIALSLLGGALAAVWFVCLPKRERWIFLTALVAFTVASTPNFFAYHRYYEPFALILLALMTNRIVAGEQNGVRRWAIWGPVALAMLLATVTIQNMR